MDREATTRDPSILTTPLSQAGVPAETMPGPDDPGQLHSLIQHIQAAVVVHGPDTAIMAASAKAAELLGLRQDEILGRTITDPIWQFLRDDGTPLPVEEFPVAQVRNTGRPVADLMVGIHRPDRRDLVWCLVNAVPVPGPEGPMAQVVVTFTNITDRRRMEEDLRERETWLHSIFRAAPVGIGVVRSRIFQEVNDTLCGMVGYTRDELLGQSARMLYPTTEEFDKVGRIMYAQIDERGTGTVETCWRRKDGAILYVFLSSAPLDLSDLSKGVTFTVLNITDRKRIEDSLRLDEGRLEALLKLGEMAAASLQEITDFALEEGVRLTKSRIGYLAFLNEDETVLTMHSWSRAAMADCEVRDKPLIYPVHRTGLWGEAVRQRKPVITNDYAAPNPLKKGYPEGHVPVTRHMNVPLFDGDKIVAVAGVGNKQEPYDDSDVRQLQLLMDGMWRLIQRKRAEEEIRTLNEELERRVADRTAKLEAVNKELETFSYSVSHDLRAPLRRIDGFSQALAEDCRDQLSEPGHEYLAWIRKECRRMAQLIDDLLNLARITRTEIRRTRINLSVMAREIIDHCRSAEPDRRVEFVLAEDLWVTADENLMRCLLENLLGNAWKFTRMRDPARIELGVTQREGRRVFFVRDNGAGFDMAYAHKLFGAFQRLHSEKDFEGTGIGLAIVQRILARHGGQIWPEAAVNEGATFYFTV